jgi:hypothetical protein
MRSSSSACEELEELLVRFATIFHIVAMHSDELSGLPVRLQQRRSRNS